MSISFRIAEHTVLHGVRLVEVLLDGNVIGSIYPQSDNTIKIASAHFSEREVPKDFAGDVIYDNGENRFPPIPSVKIAFKPRAYHIIGNRIVYEE